MCVCVWVCVCVCVWGEEDPHPLLGAGLAGVT